MGYFIIVISLLIFLVFQLFAGVTNEEYQALFFSLPLLNFTLLGLSIILGKKKYSYQNMFLTICIINFLITTTLLSILIITFFLSENPNKMSGMDAAIMYVVYLMIVFIFTFPHSYSKWRKAL